MDVSWADELKDLVARSPSGHIIRALSPRPNLEMPVWNKNIAWLVLGAHKGWEVQKNKLTQHCRILSPKGERVAWGRSEQELLQSLRLNS